MSYVIVVTQAGVHCLRYMHDAQGRAAPEGECIHIRQCTPACVTTNIYVTLKKSVKSLKSIAMSAIQSQSNRLAAETILAACTSKILFNKVTHL